MFSSFFFHLTVQIFCEEQRSQLKAENPKAGAAELSKLLSQAWRELSVDDKTPYLEQSKEMKAAAAAAAASTAASLGEDEDGEEAEPSKRKRPAAPRSAAGKKRAKRSAAEDDDGDVAVNDADQQEDDDDIDREVRNFTIRYTSYSWNFPFILNFVDVTSQMLFLSISATLIFGLLFQLVSHYFLSSPPSLCNTECRLGSSPS